MAGRLAGWLTAETNKRLSVLANTARITFAPSDYAAASRYAQPDVLRAFKYFLGCVGIVLVIEALFSFAFDTAFSDLVHHAFPVVVVLLAGFSVYVLLKIVFTPNVTLAGTLDATLNVGGAALLVMIAIVFALLTADFLVSYDAIRASSCGHRTIMCLISGGGGVEYAMPGNTTGTLGLSFPFILVVMLMTVLHYTRILAKVMRASMGVSPWRTYLATYASVIVLAPVSLFAINLIYRLLYKAL
jgi:hypothetical protein